MTQTRRYSDTVTVELIGSFLSQGICQDAICLCVLYEMFVMPITEVCDQFS